jgi:septal ring factor EnvC (AmiA/AmiB activator)
MTRRFATVLLGCLILVIPAARGASADTADDLRAQIDDHSKQIDALNKEIAQYEAQLTQVGAKKKTLQNTISSLNLTIKKTTANIIEFQLNFLELVSPFTTNFPTSGTSSNLNHVFGVYFEMSL